MDSGWMDTLRQRVEEAADRALSNSDRATAPLTGVMRYALLGGGKRVRALLVYAAGAVTGAPVTALDEAALAVEMVHAYSLVHDDLPCMDNDVLRRGRPTCHVKYGYAEAMLAGDALQPEAFVRLAAMRGVPEAQKVEIIAELARASGRGGMCGGQFIDLANVGREMDLESLRRMHLMKTGALIRASVRMGALCGNHLRFSLVDRPLGAYGSSLGLAFQVIDDILDVTAETEKLGKTAGKDSAAGKPTYVSLLGLEEARRLASKCRDDALAALDSLLEEGYAGRDAIEPLAYMADYIIGRDH